MRAVLDEPFEEIGAAGMIGLDVVDRGIQGSFEDVPFIFASFLGRNYSQIF